MLGIKICGVRSAADAEACAEAGATAIGLNFVPSSPRYVEVALAREIARAVRGSGVLVVGVVCDLDLQTMRALIRDAELGSLQLHGDESVAALSAVLADVPGAYKAIRVATAEDVDLARTFPGENLLVDAKVGGVLGGSGETFDWSLVTGLAKERKITLAGGLTPENVAHAVRAVRPHAVDVASGVERALGIKDIGAVRAFVAAARSV